MQGLLEILTTGFFHVAPILLAGLFAIAIMAERVRAFFWLYPLPGKDEFFNKIRDLIMSDRIADAIALCDQYHGKPIASVVRGGLLRANQPESLIEDGLQIAISETTQRIQRRTPFLSMIANVSTLLGLFGTILGLIHSFHAVGSASAQERSALLAAGISTAMNATMLGLAVAIPCMVAFGFLANKTNRLSAEVEEAGIRVLDLIKQRYYMADLEVVKHSISDSRSDSEPKPDGKDAAQVIPIKKPA